MGTIATLSPDSHHDRLRRLSYFIATDSNMKLSFFTFTAALTLLGRGVVGLSAAEWRSQSIYFLMTDRFARTDGSTTAPCDLGKRVSRCPPGNTSLTAENITGVLRW